MVVKSHGNNDEAFDFCLNWIELLTKEDYSGAAETILQSEFYHWTGEEIRCAIETYGTMQSTKGESYRVTPFQSASGQNPRSKYLSNILESAVHPLYPIQVVWLPDYMVTSERAGSIHLDYALNGSWSDLSSSFEILRVGDRVAFALKRIDVA